MEKRIITIGYKLPGHSDWYLAYSTNQSLLDADIIVFQPDFSDYALDPFYPRFEGKPSYELNASFRLQEDGHYWRRELSIALEAGKTIFVFFRRFQDVFVHTGNKTYSGTGRNAQVTHEVTRCDNYQFLPIELPTVVPREGKEIVFSGNPVFSSLWDEFGDSLKYESYLDGKVANPLFLTKTGEKAVGALFRVAKGSLVLLPPLEYDEKKFTKHDSKKNEDTWTPDAQRFGNRLVQVLVAIDKTLRTGGDKTPPPDWTADDCYQLAKEGRLKKEIGAKNKQIDDLVLKKNEMLTELDQESRLRDLLFEKGKNLENAIILGLETLGYKAENYCEGGLEFDQVILSPNGERFIGEAEGKDTSAVNIDKFRQLASNIQEDLQRDEVDSPAIGILFGNGFRLTKPSIRAEQFTEKCINTAKSSNCILVRTPDLFRAARYVQETKDVSFAESCRNAIRNGVGKIVDFPTNPTLDNVLDMIQQHKDTA